MDLVKNGFKISMENVLLICFFLYINLIFNIKKYSILVKLNGFFLPISFQFSWKQIWIDLVWAHWLDSCCCCCWWCWLLLLLLLLLLLFWLLLLLCVFEWAVKLPRLAKLLPHESHLNGLIPVWTLICLLTVDFCLIFILETRKKKKD